MDCIGFYSILGLVAQVVDTPRPAAQCRKCAGAFVLPNSSGRLVGNGGVRARAVCVCVCVCSRLPWLAGWLAGEAMVVVVVEDAGEAGVGLEK